MSFLYKYLKYKIKNMTGGSLKEIGAGYNVKVCIDTENLKLIYKIYTNPDVFTLADKQIEIQGIIQGKLDNLEHVKIPKLLDVNRTDDVVKLIFERIYNPYDNDPNNPNMMLNILIASGQSVSKIAGRGDIVTLDIAEKLMGKEKLLLTVHQLGEMFGLLNFKAQIVLDDIEIVIGKDSIDDQNLKFYLLDFDRAYTYNLESALNFITSNPRFSKHDFNLFGQRECFDYSSIDQNYKVAFNSGYMKIASQYNATQLANNVLQKIT